MLLEREQKSCWKGGLAVGSALTRIVSILLYPVNAGNPVRVLVCKCSERRRFAHNAKYQVFTGLASQRRLSDITPAGLRSARYSRTNAHMPVRILLADDHDQLRAAVAELLRKAAGDWEICGEAADGKAAVEKAAELKPDLVILDVLMPLRDGITAGREIHSFLPGVPVILYTSMASPAFEAEALRAGFYAAVPKHNSAALIEAIRSALATRGFAAGQPPAPRTAPQSNEGSA